MACAGPAWGAGGRSAARGHGDKGFGDEGLGMGTHCFVWQRLCVGCVLESASRAPKSQVLLFVRRRSRRTRRHPSLQDTRGVRGPQHQLYMYGPAKNDIILRKSLRAPSLHWPRYRFLTFLKRSFAGGTITAARAGHSANHSVVVTQHQGRRRITSARVLSCASPAPSRFSREKTRSQWLAHTSHKYQPRVTITASWWLAVNPRRAV